MDFLLLPATPTFASWQADIRRALDEKRSIAWLAYLWWLHSRRDSFWQSLTDPQFDRFYAFAGMLQDAGRIARAA